MPQDLTGPLVVFVIVVLLLFVFFGRGDESSPGGRGRMVCPTCGKPLKGTEMVQLEGTLYHRRCAPGVPQPKHFWQR
jgi:hypothetical protein